MAKFVATDLDGTFLNDKKQYNRDLFAQVINAYTAEGGQFIVASGRDLRHVQMLFGGFWIRSTLWLIMAQRCFLLTNSYQTA